MKRSLFALFAAADSHVQRLAEARNARERLAHVLLAQRYTLRALAMVRALCGTDQDRVAMLPGAAE